MINPTSKTAPNYVPMFLAIGAFSFVVGGAVTYQIVKMTAPTTPVAAAAPSDEFISSGMTVADVTRAATPSLAALSSPQVVEETVTAPTAPLQVNHTSDLFDDLQLKSLKEGVVAGLYTVSTDEGNRLSLTSKDGAVDLSNIKGLIATAASQGALQIPEGIETADGNVDGDTLLLALVQNSLQAGTLVEQNAALQLQRDAFTASVAKSEVVNGDRFYTVEPGDSLAYISLQFYGNPSSYTQIFQANRNKLTTPDRIFIGQKLLIPPV